MKLHLPSGLRKALLACLAALASRSRLPRTVSTGTALLGVFTMLWSTAARAVGVQPPPDAQQQTQQQVSLPGDQAQLSGDDQSLKITNLEESQGSTVATALTRAQTHEIAPEDATLQQDDDEETDGQLRSSSISADEPLADAGAIVTTLGSEALEPLAYGDPGIATIAAAKDLTWNGNTDTTLDWNTSGTLWEGGLTFATGDNVTLNSTAAGVTVNVTEAITAGSVTFGEDGSSTTWEMGLGGNFTSTGGLTISQGDTVAMWTDESSITVSLTGLTLGDGSKLTVDDFRTTAIKNLTLGGIITGGSGSEVTLSMVDAVTWSSKLTIAGSVTVTLNSDSPTHSIIGQGGLELQNSATLVVGAKDDSTSGNTKTLGAVSVGQDASIVIQTADDWTGDSHVTGDGTMRWEGLGDINQNVASSSVVTSLLGTTGTLGTLELVNTKLTAWSGVVGQLGTVKNLKLGEGASLTLDANLTKGGGDGANANLITVGAKVGAGDAITWTGEHTLSWGITLEGNAQVAAGSGTFSGALALGGDHTFTIASGNLTLGNGFSVTGTGTSKLAVSSGATLTLGGVGDTALRDATIDLTGDGKLAVRTHTIGKLNSTSGGTVTGASLTVNGGEYAGSMNLTGLTIGGSTFAYSGRDASVGALDLGSYTLNLTGEMTASSLSGGGTVSGDDGTLKLAATRGGIFSGTISSNLTYSNPGAAVNYTLANGFAGKKLEVQSGSLTLGGDTVSLGGSDGASVTVVQGATLVLGADGTTTTTFTTASDSGMTLKGNLSLKGTESNTIAGGGITLETGSSLTFGSEATNKIGGTLTLNGGQLSWSGKLEVGTLKGDGAGLSLTVGSGQELSMTQALTSAYEGNIKLQGGTLTLEDIDWNGTLTLDGGTLTATGDIKLSGRVGTLSIKDKSTLTLSMTDNVNVSGQIRISTGQTLRLRHEENSPNAALSASIDISEGGTLTITEEGLLGDGLKLTGKGKLALELSEDSHNLSDVLGHSMTWTEGSISLAAGTYIYDDNEMDVSFSLEGATLVVEDGNTVNGGITLGETKVEDKSSTVRVSVKQGEESGTISATIQGVNSTGGDHKLTLGNTAGKASTMHLQDTLKGLSGLNVTSAGDSFVLGGAGTNLTLVKDFTFEGAGDVTLSNDVTFGDLSEQITVKKTSTGTLTLGAVLPTKEVKNSTVGMVVLNIAAGEVHLSALDGGGKHILAGLSGTGGTLSAAGEGAPVTLELDAYDKKNSTHKWNGSIGGNVNLEVDFTKQEIKNFGSAVGISDGTNGSITISEGGALTITGDMYTSRLNIGTDNKGNNNILTVSGTNNEVTGDVELGEKGKITLTDGATLTLQGALRGIGEVSGGERSILRFVGDDSSEEKIVNVRLTDKITLEVGIGQKVKFAGEANADTAFTVAGELTVEASKETTGLPPYFTGKPTFRMGQVTLKGGTLNLSKGTSGVENIYLTKLEFGEGNNGTVSVTDGSLYVGKLSGGDEKTTLGVSGDGAKLVLLGSDEEGEPIYTGAITGEVTFDGLSADSKQTLAGQVGDTINVSNGTLTLSNTAHTAPGEGLTLANVTISGGSLVMEKGTITNLNGEGGVGGTLTVKDDVTVSGGKAQSIDFKNGVFDVQSGSLSLGKSASIKSLTGAAGASVKKSSEDGDVTLTLSGTTGSGAVADYKGEVQVGVAMDGSGKQVLSGTVSGDVTVKNGELSLTGTYGTGTLTVGSDSDGQTGKLVLGGSGSALNNGLAMKKGGTLEVASGAEVTVGASQRNSLNGGALVVDGTLDAAAVSGGSLTSLTLGDAGGLTLGVGELTLTEDLSWGLQSSLTVGLNVGGQGATTGTKIKLASAGNLKTEGGKLTIHLNITELNNVTSGTSWDLFSSDSGLDLSGILGNIALDLGEGAERSIWKASLNAQGKITFSRQEGDLIWKGSDTTLTWNTSEKVWGVEGYDGTANFSANDNVIFAGMSKKLITVTVDNDGVTAGNVTIQDGSYKFEGGKVAIGGDLAFTGADSDVTFAGAAELTGNLTGGTGNSITVSGSNGSLKLTKQLVSGYAGDFVLEGGTLTFAQGGTGVKLEVGAVDAGGTNKVEVTADTLVANVSKKSNAGKLTLSGANYRLTGEAAVVALEDTVTLQGGDIGRGTSLTVAGVEGGANTTLTGNITITGTGSTFSGTVNGLTIDVQGGAEQAFSGSNISIASATIGGTLKFSNASNASITTVGDGSTGTLELGDSSLTLANGGTIGGLSFTGDSGASTLTLAKSLTVSKIAISGDNPWNHPLSGVVSILAGESASESPVKLILKGTEDSSLWGSLALGNSESGNRVDLDIQSGKFIVGHGNLTVNGDVSLSSTGSLQFSYGAQGTTTQARHSVTGTIKGELGTIILANAELTIRGGGTIGTIQYGLTGGNEQGFDNNELVLGGDLTFKNVGFRADDVRRATVSRLEQPGVSETVWYTWDATSADVTLNSWNDFLGKYGVGTNTVGEGIGLGLKMADGQEITVNGGTSLDFARELKILSGTLKLGAANFMLNGKIFGSRSISLEAQEKDLASF